ncbi:hypothetical protein F3K43_17445 [Streptomyces sp. LBUM 1476]|uniref:Uncharacterized protein n=1 Tax=Streptomyces acidiscabies TaxID=42234 RepID=A0AAP6BA49_9ACTN|nr:hypothetical protein [Streptomyces acidiscabies]MBP5937572.1 hypothetical protein [Streptomyces sp. LBUM 1476]MBZ3914338.1 hypothetical protein [Streptomyces acidiscabies]MDX2960972.1 hypothetical protein [Streptomyces acidiscabies]MDX3017029.1 hypothetical protein [Streptomyces acidiscabies]GAQ54492.1 hypothetical protein a10_04305 [Streptomyces acidiscabies]
MARRRERLGEIYERDFGLTALAERVYDSVARVDEAQVLELAAEVADDCDGEGAIELGADLHCLLESDLPESVMRAAWVAATRQRFDPAYFGVNMRDWIGRLSSLYPFKLRRVRSESAAPQIGELELCEAVVLEIRHSAPELARALTGDGLSASSLESVPEALEKVVGECDGELGFRLFLRVLKVYGVSVSKDQYGRLMELDTRLRYPGPLVYEGLNVKWPPIDTKRREGVGDFGFSELASWFSGEWCDRTMEETVQRAAANDDTADPPGSAAAFLLQDALRFLDSSLPSSVITVLWLAASDRGFNLDRMDLDARDWLETIVEACRERLREAAPSYTLVMQPVQEQLVGPVLREIRDVTPLLANRVVSPGWHEVPGEAVVEALEQVATQVDPDLGYRLLIRILQVLAVPLRAEQYVRYQVLGRQFGYGEFHIGELELLVHHG